MVNRESLEKDFSFLNSRKDVLAILLYGSMVKGEETPRSDIDICIVAPECNDRAGLLMQIFRNIDVFSKRYDVKIFEELPLYIQIQVIQKHDIIYANDVYEMYEYFYYFRKLWDDQASRQHMTKEDFAEMIK